MIWVQGNVGTSYMKWNSNFNFELNLGKKFRRMQNYSVLLFFTWFIEHIKKFVMRQFTVIVWASATKKSRYFLHVVKNQLGGRRENIQNLSNNIIDLSGTLHVFKSDP